MYKARIGDSGIFTLREPFNKLVTPKVVYTVSSIRTISDIMASGELAYDQYYKSMGVGEDVFAKDAANNATILGLQAGTGEWIYVPEGYVESYPITNGVKYSSIVLGVGLGAIPDDMNLEALIAAMQDLTLRTIGVNPKVKAALIAQPAFIPHEQHEALEKARAAKVSSTETDYSRAEQLQRQLNEANKKIVELEKYIKSRP